MLRSFKDLESYKVSTLDGELGRVTDFLFDDQHFTTRYLVANTSGFWKVPSEVLISPLSFREVDPAKRLFHLGLTQDKMRNSPSLDLHRPVSRQYEREYFRYYGWPGYWEDGESAAQAMGAYPDARDDGSGKDERKRAKKEHNDPHLRSAKEVAGYHVQGRDGEIGHIADFIVDDETWTIRYLVLDTSNWWIGHKVLVAPYWMQEVSWSERKVYLELTKDAIKNSPAWSPEALVSREYEESLYDYYGRTAYWLRVHGKGTGVACQSSPVSHIRTAMDAR